MSDPAALGRRLERAWADRAPIAPFSVTGELLTPEQAYAVQRAWAAARAAAGERTVGRKIGLTSPGMQRQMGVDEPDYGDLWGSRHIPAPDGRAHVALAPFLQPRVEGELAFLLAADLDADGIGAGDVLAATEAVAPALEIVDSRIANWQIRLVDTIADNASYGGFLHGPWSPGLAARDLVDLEMELRRNDETVMRERGSAVLGSPAIAVAWLANKLRSFGVVLRAGDIVLSGSFGAAVDAHPGDAFSLHVAGEPTLRADFA